MAEEEETQEAPAVISKGYIKPPAYHINEMFSLRMEADVMQTADEAASENSDPEQASLVFICKRLRLNFKKLSEEEKRWLKKISEKSDLLKNPNT